MRSSCEGELTQKRRERKEREKKKNVDEDEIEIVIGGCSPHRCYIETRVVPCEGESEGQVIQQEEGEEKK
jgi:hypothetical protein